MHLHKYIVQGHRNNITQLSLIERNATAFTRTPPKATPSGQVEEFDSRFVSSLYRHATVSDNFEKLKQEFFK